MKKIIIIFILITSIFVIGCSNFKKLETDYVMSKLHLQIDNVDEYIIYNENNDPNELLGRQGQYIGKANWNDKRTDGEDKNCTIEVFNDKEALKNRKKYLKQFTESTIFSQYLYTHKNIIMRINGELTPSQAQEYKKVLKNI